jgi:hypothetical protein
MKHTSCQWFKNGIGVGQQGEHIPEHSHYVMQVVATLQCVTLNQTTW